MTQQRVSAYSVLITGAGKRIGAGFAEFFASRGVQTILHARDKTQFLQSEKPFLRRAIIVEADLEKQTELNALVEKCQKAKPAWRAVINNAALFENDSSENFTTQTFTRHAQINLYAPLVLTRALFRHIPEAEKGWAVNMLDNKLFALNSDFFSYTLSKSGLAAATQLMAQDFAPRLRVNAIAPGLTLRSGKQTPDSFRLAHAQTPTQSGTEIKHLTNLLAFLIDTRNINGCIIPVDGGQSLWKLPRDIAYLKHDSENGQSFFSSSSS